MKLIVVSHKETWADPGSPSGYSTMGGFPFQMMALSWLFDQTEIMVPIQSEPLPNGVIHLDGHNLSIIPLSEPHGLGWRRKLYMLYWTVLSLPLLWRKAAQADVIHTPVGGDIGTIGIFIALLQRKKLFVRHCGTWGEPISWVDRWLQDFLERIAGPRNVVLATGGSERPPSGKNENIKWIFATSYTRSEFDRISPANPWFPGRALRLITVGRLSESKNVQSTIRALPEIRKSYPDTTLDVIGDGEYRSALEGLVSEMGLDAQVVFHGNLTHEEVIRKLSGAHIFVFPTQREGFPKAVLEAMACGLGVIATRVSVLPMLLKSGGGLLLDQIGPEMVSKAVLGLIEDPQKLKEMGFVARETAREYTLENWAQAIGNHLRSAWGQLKDTEDEHA